jgi:hemerythrin-like domain-containing protein
MVAMQTGLRFRVRRAARKIWEQHRYIDEIQRELECALAGEVREPVKDLFARYRAALAAHFSIENDVYFPALHGLHPEHIGKLEQLAVEHDSFRDALEGLSARLETENGLERFVAAFQELVERLADHEAREERLAEALGVAADQSA